MEDESNVKSGDKPIDTSSCAGDNEIMDKDASLDSHNDFKTDESRETDHSKGLISVNNPTTGDDISYSDTEYRRETTDDKKKKDE